MNIDLIPNGAIKRVHVSQNDVGRTLTFELFNNSTSYTIPSGATVKIQGTKPSGFGFSETCTVSGNVATIDTTEAMTDESGNIQTELSISYDDVVIGTSNFVLAVEKNPHPSNTTDGTQITAQSLQVQINELAEIIESGGSGLTDGAKQALLNCFAHVAWIDGNGQSYYDALEDALNAGAELTSISAVYTQSGTVYDTDSLDDLKSDLVVTAHYSDSSTATVTTYTLSGTLTVGTSTITVAYGGKTTTFNVTVTELDLTLPSGYTAYDFISNPSPSTSSSSNRSQQINTQLSGSYIGSNYAHELDFAITTNANSSANYALYGCREATGTDNKSRIAFVKYTDNQNMLSVIYNNHDDWSIASLELGTRYNLKTSKGQVVLDGVVLVEYDISEDFETYDDGFISLWGGYVAGSNASALTNVMKLYKFAVKDVTTNTYVAYMIPCKNGSDVSGLYDVIRETFYTASTASKLLADNDA